MSLRPARVALTALALACERPPDPPPHVPADSPAASASGEAFSGPAAFVRVRALLARPRALGDPARAASIAALEADLRAAGATTVERLDHSGVDPRTGRQFGMSTLIGHVRPGAARRFILGTHFDTRPWAESDPDPARREQPIVGANDGTSGLAVVLELAPLLVRQLPEDIGFTVILFDGEELGRPDVGPYLAGSRALAAALGEGRFPLVARAEFGLVLDMVGDRDLRIQPDRASLAQHPALVDRIWSIGQAHGFPAFDRAPLAVPLLDDHVPLSQAGVPSILLIDYDYPAWHTHADTLDQLDARSLGAVGETLRLALLDLARRPLNDRRD